MGESSDQRLEIDLVNVFKFFWGGRKVIIVTIMVLAVFTVISVKLSDKYYKASCQLALDEPSKKGRFNTLRGLASFAGINLNLDGNSTMSPELYPSIVNSSSFILEILDEPINFSTIDSMVTLKDYFIGHESKSSLFSYVKQYTIGLPFKIRDYFSSQNDDLEVVMGEKKLRDGIRVISEEEAGMIERLTELINIELDLQTSTIFIEAELPDPLASAEVAQLTLDLLKDYLVRYQALKAKDNLAFISSSYKKADSTFRSNQRQLALFTDRNKNTSNQLASIERERLQTKYELSYQIFMGLASKLEEAKIQVNEQTPVFSVLEAVKVPLKKSRPKTLKSLILAVFIGLIMGTVIHFSRNTLKKTDFRMLFSKK